MLNLIGWVSTSLYYTISNFYRYIDFVKVNKALLCERYFILFQTKCDGKKWTCKKILDIIFIRYALILQRYQGVGGDVKIFKKVWLDKVGWGYLSMGEF